MIRSFSYALFNEKKEKNIINITTGNLSYFLDKTKIIAKANKTEFIDITIESLNSIESNYQLYYKNNNNVSIKYRIINDTPSGIIASKGNIKTVSLQVTNNTDNDQTITFGIQGGLIGEKLILEESNTIISQKATIMRTWENTAIDFQEDFHQEEYRNNITRIATKKDTLIPENIIHFWDISESKNNSVIAYLQNSYLGGYELVIGSNNKIIINPSAKCLFSNFSSAKEIYLDNFDTSGVKTMERLFEGDHQLISLNITSFDTTSVENMAGMFYKCNELIEIQVGSFNTENVNNMCSMFQECYSLEKIDLTNFDTSKVISMYAMFYTNHKLNEVLVSSKWTQVNADTNFMFYECATSSVKCV